MFNKSIFLLFVSIVAATNIFSQSCNCESNFVWVKQTFEKNDAGFLYVIDKKGTSEYEKHNQFFSEKTKSAKNNYECAEIITDWLHFFRKGHIGITVLINDIVENPQQAMRHFPDWEKVSDDTVNFKKYLDDKKEVGFEGIWDDGSYTVGIQQIDNQLVGFIIKSNVEEWKTGEVKFRIFPDSTVYYMRNHSAKNFDNVELSSINLLFFGNEFSYIRKYPIIEDKFLTSIIDRKPYFDTINANTSYLRIPSFDNNLCNFIDSVISQNAKFITAKENLVIDVRFNTGGSDICWQNIMPFISTNPVRIKNNYILSTELNNKQAAKFRDRFFIEKLEQNLGKFVLLRDEKYTTINYGKVEIPKKVAILVNNFCASSTESFLLSARQSQKVKIFGTRTMGVSDFANMNLIESPCKQFQLYYATSKDVDIEKFSIEDTGIQPDFYLDNEIPPYRWLEFVTQILNNSK
ncbi:hypothetical protein FACS1894180_6160 [Bacteroidia bacterium]|nr:hypothetical protein FACS1894180_6160 [Bacteroidia bacterium]